MIPTFGSVPERGRASPSGLVIQAKFDYAPLGADVVHQVQTAAERIRQMVKQTLEDLLAIGEELLAVKEALPHGSFGPWLRQEFGWTERTARNFELLDRGWRECEYRDWREYRQSGCGTWRTGRRHQSGGRNKQYRLRGRDAGVPD